jgi:hypothetical protein
MTTLTRSQIGDIIMSKLHSIAPDAPAIYIQATLRDIHQSSYWSAAISLARLTAIYNGVAGLASREQTELILNRLDDADIAGCGALPGDGYTAGCWHSTGCGYLRELEQRLAERDQ